MNFNTRVFKGALVASLFAVSANLSASLIAEYNFDSGLTNAVGPTYSPLAVVGAAPDLSTGSYFSDGSNSNYLEVEPAVGGANPFTVSVWVYTDSADQGGFKGIFSNNDSSGDPNSWQIDSNNGNYRAVGVDIPTRQVAAGAGRWQNLVLRKTGASQGNFWIDGVQVSSDFGANPGGLQEFRIGINRNSDRSFSGYIDNVQIWDSIEDPAAIYASGPGFTTIVPEPSTALLSIVFMATTCFRRRRRRL